MAEVRLLRANQEMDVTLSAKVNEREFEETQKIFWQPQYGLNRINNYFWHRVGFFRVMAFVLVATILEGYLTQRSHVLALCVGIAVGVGVLTGCFWHMKSVSPGLLRTVNDSLPDFVDLGDETFSSRHRDGRLQTLPWTLAEWWGAADEVIVVVFSHREVSVLPLTPLSAEDRCAVYDFVRRRLGEPRFQV